MEYKGMNLVITGFARHGKDTVCELLSKKLGARFTSSSRFVAEKAVRPWLEKMGITYPSIDELYADRVNHRADWFDAISDYCKDDGARLGRELFEGGNDIYCGLRNQRELVALREQGIVKVVVWVDASKRLPPEPESSMTIGPSDCDIILDNGGTLEQLDHEVDKLIEVIDKYRN